MSDPPPLQLGRPRWRRARLLLVVAAVAVAGPVAWFASAATDGERLVATPGGSVRVVTVPLDGHARRYRLFVPDRLPGGAHALLVALHPLHWSATRFERRSGLDAGARAANAVIAYPDGIGRSWDAGSCCGAAARSGTDDVEFLTTLVRAVESRVRVDPRRIAVTGFSNGALMSYRLLCQRPDIFHTAVVVAGGIVVAPCPAAGGIELMHVHGALDGIIPLGGITSSPIDVAGFPSAADSVGRIAEADGCTGGVAHDAGGYVRWSASGCAAGARVELLTVKRMAHHYPSGTADADRFGVDAATMTWSFLAAVWSR